MAGQETRRRDDFSRPVLIVRCDKIDYSRSFLAPGKNEKKMKWRRPTIRLNGTKKPFTRLSSVARIAVTRAIYCITDEKFHRVMVLLRASILLMATPYHLNPSPGMGFMVYK